MGENLNDRGAPVLISAEVADIDKDREILVALIGSATDLLSIETKGAEHLEPLRDPMTKFLKTWIERKTPGLDVDRLPKI